ncbi:hypothetical protein D3C77_416550 [compost metagenome]
MNASHAVYRSFLEAPCLITACRVHLERADYLSRWTAKPNFNLPTNRRGHIRFEACCAFRTKVGISDGNPVAVVNIGHVHVYAWHHAAWRLSNLRQNAALPGDRLSLRP